MVGECGDGRADHAVPILGVLLTLTAIALTGLTALTRDVRRSAVTIALLWLPVLACGHQLDAIADASKPQWHEPGLVALNAVLTMGLVVASWRK